MADLVGINVETLRYYVRRGIIAEPDRSLGGHRMYSEETVTTLRVIKAAQHLGFTLFEVAELLEAGRHRHGSGLQAKTEAKLAEVERKIADLEVIRDSLVAAREAGCDDLVACAGSECCPIPFVQITTRPETSSRSSLPSRTATCTAWAQQPAPSAAPHRSSVCSAWQELPPPPSPSLSPGSPSHWLSQASAWCSRLHAAAPNARSTALPPQDVPVDVTIGPPR
ncbi:MerR family transcriptional regulator [Terrabacter sp. Root181]|uniref:MerR family transcriptional regulator n=1 Tax=Terrabacter sp. Root181 TaxID=1736484 RepID=UPI001F3E7EF7|nr:MerR family transcriptional regulator [Terrabacter sp. Root181]